MAPRGLWVKSFHCVVVSLCPPIHYCCLQQHLPLSCSHHYYHKLLDPNFGLLPRRHHSTTTMTFDVVYWPYVHYYIRLHYHLLWHHNHHHHLTPTQASQSQSPSSAPTVSSSAIMIGMDCSFTGPPACSPTGGSFEHHHHHLHLTITFSSTELISIVTCYLVHSQRLYISPHHHHHDFISVESQTLKVLTNTSLFTIANKSRVEAFIEICQ